MTIELRRIESASDTSGLAEALEADGAAIVKQALSPAQLTTLNEDFDRALEGIGPGLRHPPSQFLVEFYGRKTIRIDGLPGKSEAFVELLEDSFMTRIADRLVLPHCEHYLLNTGQLIQIGPGEGNQMLHRDEGAWSHFAPTHLLQVEAMFALTRFTRENGCTRVVPGSHLWDPDREANEDEIGRAEMDAGDALVYLGSTMHGGGANTTADEWRRGMFFGLVVGWLRTEENLYLTVPFDKVRAMPEVVRERLGYRAHEGIGVVDVGDPMALFQQPG